MKTSKVLNIAIAGIIIISNLLTTTFGYKTCNFGILSGYGNILVGIIPLSISFFFLDIYTNHYGISYAKRLIYTTFLIRVAFVVILSLLILMLGNKISVFGTSGIIVSRAMVAGAIASLISLNLNCLIFAKLNTQFNGRLVWLRCVVATSVGELVYSLVASVIYMYNQFSLSNIMQLSFNGYWFKFLFEVFTLPFTYLFIDLLHRLDSQIRRVKLINFKII